MVGQTLIYRVPPAICGGAQQNCAEDSRTDVFRAINRRRRGRQERRRKFPSESRSFMCVCSLSSVCVCLQNGTSACIYAYYTSQPCTTCLRACVSPLEKLSPRQKFFPPIFHFKTRLAPSKLTHTSLVRNLTRLPPNNNYTAQTIFIMAYCIFPVHIRPASRCVTYNDDVHFIT